MGRRWVFFLSGHLYYFTRSTARKLLERTGFHVLDIRPHVQWLELDYLLLRAEALGGPLVRLMRNVAGWIGLSHLQVPYWIGQTFVLARATRSGSTS